MKALAPDDLLQRCGYRPHQVLLRFQRYEVHQYFLVVRLSDLALRHICDVEQKRPEGYIPNSFLGLAHVYESR